jgi:prolyl-tRNA editing enzyme YbaK/EbsC (Cys-tRNA(Pro) deacylase)
MTEDAPIPLTPAIEALKNGTLEHRVVVTERASSAEESAAFQGLPVERLLKSIVVRRGENDYVFVLVPGDRQIDWRKLRRHLGCRGCRCRSGKRRNASPVTSREPSLRLARQLRFR